MNISNEGIVINFSFENIRKDKNKFMISYSWMKGIVEHFQDWTKDVFFNGKQILFSYKGYDYRF